MGIYGYVRVSSRDQNEERQLIAMRNVEVPESNLYVDKVSGKDFERPMYLKMVAMLEKDDIVYIKSIDRLGRNYKEIVDQWQYLTRVKQVDIAVLDMPLLDTRRGKDLLGTFLSDIVLQVLSFVAENERANIRIRQKEGIEAAKARGVRFGRPIISMPDDFEAICRSFQKGEITADEAARRCGCSRATFFSRVARMKKEKAEVRTLKHT